MGFGIRQTLALLPVSDSLSFTCYSLRDKLYIKQFIAWRVVDN